MTRNKKILIPIIFSAILILVIFTGINMDQNKYIVTSNNSTTTQALENDIPIITSEAIITETSVIESSLVTSVPVTTVPVTTVPITTASVTSVPVTTVPVTIVPITTAPVTNAPVTTVPNPSTDGESYEGVSDKFPNGTVTKVGDVPSGATLIKAYPDGARYTYTSTLPSGATISTATVCTSRNKTLVVLFAITSPTGVSGLARVDKEGHISFSFGNPGLSDEDKDRVRFIAEEFRLAHMHHK